MTALTLRFLALFIASGITASPTVDLIDLVSRAKHGDVITLEPTTYSGIRNCDMQIQKDLTLISPTSETVIDCLSLSRCLTVSDGASVTIVGVILKNGNPMAQSATSRRVPVTFPARKPLPVRRRHSHPKRVVVRITVAVDPTGDLHVTTTRVRRRHSSARARAIEVTPTPFGGGLWVRQASVVLSRVTVTGCSAYFGGGIMAQDSSVVASDTILHKNGFVGYGEVGGGGAFFTNCSVHLVNVTASQNFLSNCYSGLGGGFHFQDCKLVALQFVSALGNFVTTGPSATGLGGGYCFDSCGDVTIESSTAVGNNLTATLGNAVKGAGFFVRSCSNIAFHSASAIRNSLTGDYCEGGGYYILSTPVTMSSSTAIDNTLSTWETDYVSSRGGGFSFETCPTIAIQSTSAIGNTVSSHGSGINYGSGYYFYSCKLVTIAFSSAFANTVMSTGFGAIGYGAGLSAAGAGSYYTSNSIFENNVILGAGGGGAVGVMETARILLSSCVLQNNSAHQAGAISVNEQSSLSLFHCAVIRNTGQLFAGAITTSGSITLTLLNTSFQFNYAPRLPIGLAISDGVFIISGSRFADNLADGLALLLLGTINVSSNIFYTSAPGTICTNDSSSGIFSISYSACSAGSYAVFAASTEKNQTQCFVCPFGAICNGADKVTNGLRAQKDYFGVRTGTEVKFYPCLSGFCCNNASHGCPYNFCEGDRVGPLCGQCAAGSGLVFFAEHCASNSDCNDASWAAVVVIVAALVIALYLIVSTPRPSNGGLSVLLFFYQVHPLVKSTPWQGAASSVTAVLTSLFSMSPSTGSSSGVGVCVVSSMTASQRLGARMLFQGAVLGALLILFLSHRALHKLSLPWFQKHSPNGVQYFGAFVRLVTIAYTTLILVPLQMMQCVEVSKELVWWYNAEIRCYDAPWQKAAIFAVALLSPLPFVCVVVLQRWRSEDGLTEWQCEVRRVLGKGFREERRWWLGVSLLRRLLLVVSFTTIRDQAWKGIATAVLCLIFVMTNLRLQPFEARSTQNFETVSLALLACLAASSTPSLARIQYGTTENISNVEALEWLQFVATVTPVVGFALLLVLQVVWARLSKSRPIETVEHIAGRMEERDIDASCGSCGRSFRGVSADEWGAQAMADMGQLPTMCSQCQFC